MEAQRELIAVYCQKNGHTIEVECVDENVSGGLDIDKRPGLLVALDALADQPGSVLVVAKRCRLARDGYVAAMVYRLVERSGSRVECADGVANGSSPEDILMRGMLDLFAQYERELIRARTRAALAAKRRRGEFTGGKPPYGQRVGDGGKLEPHQEERECAKRASKLRSTGLSLRKIAVVLQEEGHRARGGVKWNHMRVKTAINSLHQERVKEPGCTWRVVRPDGVEVVMPAEAK